MLRKWIACMLVLSLVSCGPNLIKNQNQGEALGTSYSITYISETELNFQEEIDGIFNAINQSLSTYIPDSDISKINRGDTTVVVDELFQEVFRQSIIANRISDGYFDPTVGPLVNAWGFGPGAALKMNKERVDSLMQYVGFNKVGLRPNNRVYMAKKGMYLDFNAIAKGYAIDRLGVLLSDKGISDYLIEVGGEVLANGKNTISDRKWSVAIEDPEAGDSRKVKRLVALSNKALASSGNYRKFRRDPETGQRYVHTIDPKTGYTRNSRVLSATVIAATCAQADAYATAFMAMGLDRSKDLLEKHSGLEGYLIYIDDSGNTQEYFTRNFAKLIVN